MADHASNFLEQGDAATERDLAELIGSDGSVLFRWRYEQTDRLATPTR